MTCIRRSINDTDLLVYALRDYAFEADRQTDVDVEGSTVYFNMVDSESRLYDVDDGLIFDTVDLRDAYFVTNPTELVDGLVVQVTTVETSNVPSVTMQYRWSGSFWTTNTNVVVDSKLCGTTETSGRVTYQFKPDEVKYGGMYLAYFTVVTPDYGTLDEKYIFDDVTARNAYFVTNPDELIDELIVAVGLTYYSYDLDGVIWVEGDSVSTTSVKYPRNVQLWIFLIDVNNMFD